MSEFTTTPKLGLYKPAYNQDDEHWGDHLNANADVLDAAISGLSTDIGGPFLPLAGGTMEGPLNLVMASTAVTATPGSNTTQIATTAFVANALATNPDGVASFNTRTGAVTLITADVTAAGGALIASPAFTGNPTAPTPATGGADTSVATTAFVQAAVAPALHNVGRNLIHNSMFNVAQRGVGPFTASGYTADRWNLVTSGGTRTAKIGAHSDASRASIGDEAARFYLEDAFTGTSAAGDLEAFVHPVEGVYRTAGKTVTLSFWANSTGIKVGVEFSQYFGSGGSPSVGVSVASGAITVPNAWVRYTVTATIPSVAGKTLGTDGNDQLAIWFWLSAGSSYAARASGIGVQSGTFQIWGVQLEIGTVASPLEKPDPELQLRQCQRFYQLGAMIFQASGQVIGNTYQGSVMLPVTMRAAPVLTITANAGANLTGLTIANYGQCVFAGGTATASGACGIIIQFTASADL